MADRWRGLAPNERPFREAAPYYGTYRYRPSEEFARLLATHLEWSPDDRVLDLGAGPAHVSTLFAPYVGEVVAMEPDEAMLDAGRKRAVSARTENLTFVHGGSGDLERLRPSLGGFRSRGDVSVVSLDARSGFHPAVAQRNARSRAVQSL